MLQDLLTLLKEPWPWYVAGPLIGLMVPALLLLGNKSFGLSSNLQHLCAVCLPGTLKPQGLRYDWRRESWALMLALGLLLGGLVGGVLLANPAPIQVSDAAKSSFQQMGVSVEPGLLPSFLNDLTPKVMGMLALSGLLVGFGTRYGGGCTAGHAIMGLSTLQKPSLIATVAFFMGGIISANVLLPLFLGGH